MCSLEGERRWQNLYQLGTDQREKVFSRARIITRGRNCDILELFQRLLHGEDINQRPPPTPDTDQNRRTPTVGFCRLLSAWSALVGLGRHMSAYVGICRIVGFCRRGRHMSAYVGICRHMSAYVGFGRHMSAFWSAYVGMSAFVGICRLLSASDVFYVCFFL